ncbi:hypothetical protein GCM10009682_19870 [Luedemannella flava]|uniref:non-specific serine/threonine protein kinase n=2 Tax=Luedemannella flava TaxID=349316 RepID=A0ABP4Y391_9ACTN
MLQRGVTLDERYVLREPVGRGGMGEVWRADDTVLGRVVAVKVLLSNLSGDTEFAERFYAEARAMAALSDPNIVEVYDYGQAFGMAYLVMQFVPGESLRAVLRRTGPLPAHEVMNLVTQAGRALHHAHVNGFVHRDVKPGNLLIRPDGRLILTDFGIARSIAATRLTQSGFIVGTPSYLAPEQFAGAPSGPAADIYALGVVAYECLTLRPPFVGDTPAALAAMQVRNEPPPLPPSVPESVRTVVMRALEKEPWQRWSTAAAMADAAVAAAAGAVVPWTRERRPGSAPAEPGPAPMGSSGRLAVPPTATSGRMIAPATGPTVPMGSTSPDIAAPPMVPIIPAAPVGVSPRAQISRTGRRRVVLVAGAGLLIAALVGWATLVAMRPDRVVAAPPGATSSSQPTPSRSPSAGVTTSTPPTTTAAAPRTAPARTTTRAPVVSVRTTTKVTTRAPATTPTPGPGQVSVPNVIAQYEYAADYVIRGATLQPEFTYVDDPVKCYVVAQDPPAGSIVPKNSRVVMTVARYSTTCQPGVG